MAREDEFEGQYLQEMPDCLRDLFKQTSSKQSDCFVSSYFQNSTETYKSVLDISGLKLPPPPLTEKERSKMCHYRREAVKCEARLMEKRGEKYSDLISQVMSVMDKIQEQKEAKLDIECANGRTVINEMHERKVTPCSTVSHQDDCKRRTGNVPGIRQSKEQELKANPMVDSTRNQGNTSLKDAQLNLLHNSLGSPVIGHEESRHFQGTYRREVNTKEHPSDGRFILEAADQPLSSTMHKDLTELKRPFSQLSVISEGVFCNNESDQMEINKQQDRRGPEFDSLSSTSLSVTFSDFSNATVCSVVESEFRPTSQQHPDAEAEMVNDSHYKCFDKQQVSTTQMKHLPSKVKHSSELFKSQTSNGTHASKGGSQPNQDKTLENLEKQRQNLLEEKQRQLDALKQQELKRLLKQQKEQFVEFEQISVSTFCSTPTLETERPRSSSLPSKRSLDFKPSTVLDRASPLRRPISMPVGNMYSILELSGENPDFESESSSDKENHVVNGNLSVTRNDAKIVLRNGTMRTNSGKNKHLSSLKTGDVETSSLISECFKVFPSNGRDRFARLSAHAKGFLTRLLMKTDKIQGLVKNIKDTRDVLEDLSKDGTQTVQEKMLMENVESHLKGARENLHDVFFTIPIKEKMSYIAHSRSLANAKHEKRVTRSSLSHSKLSAVTLKAIQRRQEGLENTVRQTENPEIKPKPEAREERKRKNWNIRVLKPQQCHSSPVLHERTRSQRQVYRPSTAPGRQINSRHSKAETEKRPETADPVSGKTEGPWKLSTGGGNVNQNTKRLGRKSLGGIRQHSKMSGALGLAKDTVQPRAQKRLSLPAQTVQPRLKAYPGMNDVTKRPQTASEVRRTSRMIAANFAK